MKQVNIKLSVVLSLAFCALDYTVNAQQFGGNNNQTDPIYRSGNVGIGDSNFGGTLPPLAPMHLRTSGGLPFMVERYNGVSNQNNSLKISFTSSAATGITVGSGSGIFQLANPYNVSDMVFMHNPNAVGFILKANGNFGIGTVSPNAKFAVSDGTSSQLRISGNATGDIESTGAFTFHYGSTNTWNILSGTTNRFQITSDGSTILTPNGGTVGIATSTPNNLVKLHVAGEMLVSGMAWPSSAAFIRANTTDGDPTKPEYTWWNNSQTGIFHPGGNMIGFSSNGLEAMRVHSNGYIGIGTTVPDARLTVSNDNGVNKLAIYGNSAGDIAATGSFSPHYDAAYTGTANPANNFNIYEGTPGTGTLRFKVASGGNTYLAPVFGKVGIHTTSPQTNLDIHGTMDQSAEVSLHADYDDITISNLRSIYWAGSNDYETGGGAQYASQYGFGTTMNEPGAITSQVAGIFVKKQDGSIIRAIEVFNTGQQVRVPGVLTTKTLKVTATGWSDYVFDNKYKLRDLSELEAYYKLNKHLPEIPSENEVINNGIDVAEMNKLLLQKVEELTIYLVEQNKKVEEMQKELEQLKGTIEKY